MTTAANSQNAPSGASSNVSSPAGISLAGVLSARSRPPRPGPVSVSLTFGWRAVLKIKHVPMQLFDVTGFPIMFTLMFTFLFGGALLGVLVGALLGDALRYSIAATVVIVLGLILGFRPEGPLWGMPLAVGLLLVFAFSLSWIWTMLGLILKSMESVMMVSSMVIFFLTFASNIFVDPRTMPGWLQVFVINNPISHTATAVRGLMHGTVTWGQIAWVLASSAVLVGIFGPITMRLYRRKQ